ncbi:hypothetical protein QHF89_29305 [Polyangium sorediatum]|uniref:Uncharacterized protein n=2 Tax=Polyangium sorediatum TaxID=889274 RepID=A0ABT6NZ51_9BACT|nr:hypothetical protein [Polyangium sorediatum]
MLIVACSGENNSGDPSGGNGGSGGNGAGAGAGSASSSGAGAGSSSGSGGNGGMTGNPMQGQCSTPTLTVTEVELPITVEQNEDEVNLRPLAISPKPSGGSRLAFMGADDKVHVAELDVGDKLVGDLVDINAHDFADLHADDNGGVLLLTRDAQGGGTLNCGNPTNLCGNPPNPPVACHDMYMVRFDGKNESWATKLTSSSAALPPYSTGKTGPDVFMIWWYAHHGRIASDGTNFAGYFGAAISVSQGGCINIHQGDRMKVVSPTGEVLSGGFDWGCSHSGYERITWDPAAKKYVSICKTDNNNRIAYAPAVSTIKPVDLAYSNLSDVARDPNGGSWALTSDRQNGQPALANGLAEVHLLHFNGGEADKDIVIAGKAGENARAPYLANYSEKFLLAGWETSTATGDLTPFDGDRKMHVQVLSATTGEAVSAVLDAGVPGNRYQAFRAFPDGSVAFAAKGTKNNTVRIFRAMPCAAE